MTPEQQALYAADLAAKAQAIASLDDKNQGPAVNQTVWILLAISTLVIAGRIYVKTRRANRLYWDDFAMGLALLFGYGHAASISIAVHHGLGRHIVFLLADERTKCLRIGMISLAWGFLSPMMGRISFCITLYFLAGTDSRVKKWPIHLFIFLQVVVNLVTLGLFFGQCGNDLPVLWDGSRIFEAADKCLDPRIQTDLGYFQGSVNTLTDLYLTILPGILIEHTKLSLKSKIGLGCLLCMSILAMIASIVKTYEAKALSTPIDFTWDLCAYVIWMSVELNVVMIVSSIPLLRPLFRRQTARAARQLQRFDAIKMNSVFSKSKSSRSGVSEITSVSEEDLTGSAGAFPGREREGITITQEVEITYEAKNAPFVHAALVGLVQGEISRRRPGAK